jgi:hypothetical protein
MPSRRNERAVGRAIQVRLMRVVRRCEQTRGPKPWTDNRPQPQADASELLLHS